MKKYLYLFLLALSGFILSIGLTGCNAKGQHFDGFSKAPNNKGTLYVYRPSALGASGIKYSVYNINTEKKIGDLRNGGYVKYITKPGKLSIGLLYDPDVSAAIVSGINWKVGLFGNKASAPVYTVNIKPNAIACIRWDAGNLKGGPVNEATCRKEIVNTRLSD